MDLNYGGQNMLVLSRKIGERIVIDGFCGREIVVTVLSVVRGTVRLGFEAERTIPILRAELLKEKSARIA